MFKLILKAVDAALKYIGIRDEKFHWKWTGKAGSPSWAIRLSDEDSIVYEATVTPSSARPLRLGSFINFDERYKDLQTMRVGNRKMSYVPHASRASLVYQFEEMGMSRRKAEQSAIEEIRHEMHRTEAFESGNLQLYRLVIIAKSGSTVLATDIVDGIAVNPEDLMFGTDRRVIGMVMDKKPELRNGALITLRFLKRVSETSDSEKV